MPRGTWILIRTVAAVPMLKGDQLVGTITIYKLDAKPFTDKQNHACRKRFAGAGGDCDRERALVSTRWEARHARDLTEALQLQNPRPSGRAQGHQPIGVRSAGRFFERADLFRRRTLQRGSAAPSGVRDRGRCFATKGSAGRRRHPRASRSISTKHPATPGRGTMVGRVLLSGKVEHIRDRFEDTEYGGAHGGLSANTSRGLPRRAAARAKPGSRGALVLTRRGAWTFSPIAKIEIVQNLRRPGRVIAIENVRLFDEVQAKRRRDPHRSACNSRTATAGSAESHQPLGVPICRRCVGGHWSSRRASLCDAPMGPDRASRRRRLQVGVMQTGYGAAFERLP